MHTLHGIFNALFVLWLAAIGTLLPSPACAQSDSSAALPTGMGIEVRLLAGKVFRHEEKFTLPIPALTTAIDINFIQHTSGRKEWEQRCHYPRLGIGITALHYGIDSIYGNLVGIYPNITLPLVSGKHLEWTLRLGNGLGYVTKRFSRTDPVNTVNVAVGSHLNDFILINTDASFHLSQRLFLKAGIYIQHISSGSFRKPNLGINTTGASLGLTYFPARYALPKVQHELPPLSQRYLVQAKYGMSLVSANTPGGPLYPVYIGTAYISRRWRNTHKLFAGIDYSYHQNIHAYLRDNNLQPGNEKTASAKSALVGGIEFLLGRVGISLQAGAYIHKAWGQSADVYEKVSGHYYLVQHEHGPIKELFVYTSLKTHLNVAEMGEMGLGIGL